MAMRNQPRDHDARRAPARRPVLERFKRWLGLGGVPRRGGARQGAALPPLGTLEQRDVPAVSFGVFSGGTYAFDDVANTFRQISPFQAAVLTEGASGTLFASWQGLGTFGYDYNSNAFTRLSPAEATALSATANNV